MCPMYFHHRYLTLLFCCIISLSQLALAQERLPLSPTASPQPSIELPNPARFALIVEQGDLDTVTRWLDAGLPPDFMGSSIGSGLMIAAWKGDIAMMDLFLKKGARIEQANRYDETALLLASWRGHLDAVRWLLDHGVQATRSGERWSALHYAAFSNRPEITQLLIERGAAVNARAPNGSTVLMMAAREGHEALAQQLLTAGADPKAVNERGENALIWAMRHEHFSIAQMVANQEDFARAAKADPNSFGSKQRSIAAPPEIEEVLRQMRLAEAAGQNTQSLRATLLTLVDRYKKESQHIVIGAASSRKTTPSSPKGKPNALMITARRKTSKQLTTESGERAELVYAPAKMLPATTSAKDDKTSGDEVLEIPEILARIQQAQAAGQPVEALREALFRAVARSKNQP